MKVGFATELEIIGSEYTTDLESECIEHTDIDKFITKFQAQGTYTDYELYDENY